jgi:23S rRNA pseudouridine2605 synthase
MRFARNTHIGASSAQAESGERIAKVIARAGICSRRDAEKLIADGRVTLNGKRLATPAVNVSAGDKIAVDGTPLPTAEAVRLWRYYKPRGRVTTHRDPQGRPTVFEALPEDMPRVISVGRLDFNTEGLLLLTNAGALARHMESPATGWLRRYRVRVHGAITQPELDAIAEGVEIEGIRYGPIEARLDRVQGANCWLTLGIREGKNREVRKVMEHLKLGVTRLIRLSFGPFSLGDLEPGQIDEVKRRIIAEQLGAEMADKLGIAPKHGERDKSRDKPRGAPAAGRAAEGKTEKGQAGRGMAEKGKAERGTAAKGKAERGKPEPRPRRPNARPQRKRTP